MDTFEKSPGLSAREAVNHAVALQTAMNREGGKRVTIKLQEGVTTANIRAALGSYHKGISFSEVDGRGNIEATIFTNESRISG